MLLYCWLKVLYEEKIMITYCLTKTKFETDTLSLELELLWRDSEYLWLATQSFKISSFNILWMLKFRVSFRSLIRDHWFWCKSRGLFRTVCSPPKTPLSFRSVTFFYLNIASPLLSKITKRQN